VTEFLPLLTGELYELKVQKLDEVDAVPTPFPTWNAMCRDEGGGVGLARGWHVVVSGGTGQGKSLLALNLAAEAVRAGERVVMISLEMSKVQLDTRFMAIFAGKDIRSLEQGKTFDESVHEDASRQLVSNNRSTGGQLIRNTEVVSDLTEIEMAIRYHAEQGCRYFITDYIQLAWTGAAAAIFDQIKEVSHTIRGLARELSVVDVAVSQFNRDEMKSGSRPTIYGLMGGGPLEQDADQIALLDHTS
jgi:replicative DNA helicase